MRRELQNSKSIENLIFVFCIQVKLQKLKHNRLVEYLTSLSEKLFDFFHLD